MAKGIQIPVKVNAYGGTSVVEGDSYADQVLRIGLSGHSNMNAFQQDTGLGEGMIFGLDSTSTKASVLRRLYAIFEEWEAQRLYKLMAETIKWVSDSSVGDLILEFKYINLETDQVKSFEKRFLSGG